MRLSFNSAILQCNAVQEVYSPYTRLTNRRGTWQINLAIGTFIGDHAQMRKLVQKQYELGKPIIEFDLHWIVSP